MCKSLGAVRSDTFKSGLWMIFCSCCLVKQTTELEYNPILAACLHLWLLKDGRPLTSSPYLRGPAQSAALSASLKMSCYDACEFLLWQRHLCARKECIEWRLYPPSVDRVGVGTRYQHLSQHCQEVFHWSEHRGLFQGSFCLQIAPFSRFVGVHCRSRNPVGKFDRVGCQKPSVLFWFC